MTSRIKKRYTFYVSILSIFAVSLILFSYSQVNKSEVSKIKTNESHHLSLLNLNIVKFLDKIKSNTEIISSGLIKNTSNKTSINSDSKKMGAEILRMIKAQKIFDKIRLIGNDGWEKVRVNYNNGNPNTVPKEKLQFKGKRYYFIETDKLSKNQIYISQYDLNIENGSIEKPLKPLFRIGIPLFSNHKKKLGVLIFNILPNDFVAEIKKANPDYSGSPQILNSDSYWLQGGNKKDRFGFMLANKKNTNFKSKYPKEWKIINKSDKGQFVSDLGVFTFQTLHPEKVLSFSSFNFVTKKQSDSNLKHWKLVSFLPSAKLNELSANNFYVFLGFGIFTFILILGGGYIIAKFRVQEYKAEIDSKKNLVRFQQVVEATGDWIWEVDKNGLYTYCSKASINLLGYKPDEIIGKKYFYDFYKQDKKDELKKSAFKIFSKKETFVNYENLNIHKDGSEIFVLTSGKPIVDAEGNLLGYRGADKNITERKLTENAFLESEERNRSITETAADAIITIDSEGVVQSWNRTATKIFGFDAVEMIGNNLNAIITDQHKQKHERGLKRLRDGFSETKMGKLLELHAINKNGNEFPIELTLSMWKNASNKKFYTGIIRDISERKKNENKMIESEKRFRVMFENAPLPYQSLDSEGYFLDVNPAWLKALGYEIEEVIGKHFGDFMSPESVLSLKNKFLKFKSEGEIHDVQFSMVRKNGEQIIVAYEGKIALDEFGNFKQTHCIFSDITERKIYEAKLLESENRFSMLMQQSPAVIEIYNSDGLQVIVNKAYEELWGFPASRTVNIFNLFKSKEVKASGLLEYINRAYSGKTVKVPEYKFDPTGDTEAHGAGRARWLSTKIYPLKDHSGKVGNIVITHEDITERKLAEKELKESEEKFRLTFLTSPDSININRLSDGLYVDINNGFTEITDYTREDAIGKTSRALDIWVNQKDREKLVAGLKEFGIVNNLEAEFRKKDGTIIHGLMSASIIDIDGVPHIISVTRNYEEIYQAQKIIKESESKYMALFNSIQDSIIVADLRRNIVNCNTSFEYQFGYKKEELFGKRTHYIYENTEQFEELGAQIKEHIDDNSPFSYAVNYKRKDGSVFPGETAVFYLKDSNGNTSGFIGLIRDITEKKKSQLEIQKLSQAIEQNPISVVITDLVGNIEYVNPYFTVVTGYKFEEAIGQNPRVLKSGEQTQEFYKEMWDTISSGNIWEGEFHNKKKNGELYWEEAVITPIKDENGKTINYCALKTDVTEKKKITEELNKYREHLESLVEERTRELSKSEETFRALAENIHDSIMRFDRNHKHLYVNPIVEQQTGISASDFIGKTHEELNFPKDLVKIWHEAIEKVFIDKKDNAIDFMLPTGIWINWQLVPEFDSEGNVTAIITSGRDITKAKEVEKSLNAALQKEKELNELKTQFISTVSHEFRTPLTSIFSSVDLLELFGDKWSIEKKKKQFNQMRGSIHRLTGMLDDVLQISRTESGKTPVNYEKIDIGVLIKSILKEAEPLLTPKHKFVNNIILEQKSYYLDKEIIRTILLNLLSNAIKYSPEGGNIEIISKREEIHLLLSVKDVGLGIKEKDLKDIFSKFFRTEDAGHIQGTGLGLSIVKRLVAKINGEITVSSKFGEGTIFTVKIPINANEN